MIALAAARAVVVVAPHPDDEAIGAWGLMRRLARAGARIAVVVASDGGASHPGSVAWPRARLVRERRRETRRVLRELGVAPPAISFLNLPDGALATLAPRLRRLLARAVRRMGAATLVVGPAPGDAHADHRAVAAALARVPARWRLSYHVWPLGAGRRADRRARLAVPLSPPQLAMKRRVLRGYRTQAGLIADADAGFAMDHRHFAAFARPSERFGSPA